ncbi:MAG TPA: hypothetical protein DCZ69_04115 [Syntrophobacteraceae bacterium]|nr:hypothetical protein [Syntrophobacteraceae bacterium]HBD07424.1 hypothetical protein [Syntrophobacteraceae bacterium]HBZ53856.1 hypothetical protein [Syntrophobacteraceae bacterium]
MQNSYLQYVETPSLGGESRLPFDMGSLTLCYRLTFPNWVVDQPLNLTEQQVEFLTDEQGLIAMANQRML